MAGNFGPNAEGKEIAQEWLPIHTLQKHSPYLLIKNDFRLYLNAKTLLLTTGISVMVCNNDPLFSDPVLVRKLPTLEEYYTKLDNLTSCFRDKECDHDYPESHRNRIWKEIRSRKGYYQYIGHYDAYHLGWDHGNNTEHIGCQDLDLHQSSDQTFWPSLIEIYMWVWSWQLVSDTITGRWFGRVRFCTTMGWRFGMPPVKEPPKSCFSKSQNSSTVTCGKRQASCKRKTGTLRSTPSSACRSFSI